jgi:hypothetical protein
VEFAAGAFACGQVQRLMADAEVAGTAGIDIVSVADEQASFARAGSLCWPTAPADTSPQGWGWRLVEALDDFAADRIVVKTNMVARRSSSPCTPRESPRPWC